jgi:hypothetical protein
MHTSQSISSTNTNHALDYSTLIDFGRLGALL